MKKLYTRANLIQFWVEKMTVSKEGFYICKADFYVLYKKELKNAYRFMNFRDSSGKLGAYTRALPVEKTNDILKRGSWDSYFSASVEIQGEDISLGDWWRGR